MRIPHWIKAAAALWLGTQAACSSPTTPGKQPPVEPPDTSGHTQPPPVDTTPKRPSMSVSSVENLVPGELATLHGTALLQVTSLTVDGESVPFTATSDSAITFVVPTTRACETDGRPVSLVLNGTLWSTGHLQVRNTLHLDVGESKILSVQELPCVQLPAGPESYVLSVANFDTGTATPHVLDLKVLGTRGSPTSFEPLATSAPGAPVASGTRENAMPRLASAERVVASPGLGARAQAFGDYGSAQVGDVIQMVDWGDPRAFQATSIEQLPTYPAKVLALAGRVMVTVDQRIANLSEIEAATAKLQQAAALADQWALPAIRAVVNPDYQPLPGSGGRIVVHVSSMPGALGGFEEPQMKRPSERLGASETHLVVLSAEQVPTTAMSVIANTIVHEMAHMAAFQGEIHDGEPLFSGGADWYMEAMAVSVEDMAARMALGQERQAPAYAVVQGNRNVPWSRLAALQDDDVARATPFSGEDGRQGPYERGARILRFAQQAVGQSGFSPNGTLLHQRLAAKARTMGRAAWTIESIAQEVGLTVQQLLEQSMMAELTDDQIAPEAVEKYQVPQLEAWNHVLTGYQYISGPQRVLKRTENRAGEVKVPDGGYQFWYIDGDEQNGLSIQGENVDPKPTRQVKLTRLR
ncbi:MAG TPA: hypothetical protein VF178_15545 [Gemmatimonadaceae bacterium]